MPDAQQQILDHLKQQREATNAEIASHLGVSYEAARQQLRQLEASRLVETSKRRDRPGRPVTVYRLSPAGDHLFPKNYDKLAVELIDTVADSLGPAALEELLAGLTDRRVQSWAPRLERKSLEERLELLKGIYQEDDPYAEVHVSGEDLSLVEHNCPYLNVAQSRPVLCSVTLSALARLSGLHVSREERIQAGDGRCVFRFHRDRPVEHDNFRFAFEEVA